MKQKQKQKQKQAGLKAYKEYYNDVLMFGLV